MLIAYWAGAREFELQALGKKRDNEQDLVLEELQKKLERML